MGRGGAERGGKKRPNQANGQTGTNPCKPECFRAGRKRPECKGERPIADLGKHIENGTEKWEKSENAQESRKKEPASHPNAGNACQRRMRGLDGFCEGRIFHEAGRRKALKASKKVGQKKIYGGKRKRGEDEGGSKGHLPIQE